MRFISQQWRDGQWKAVELPGAANLDAWEESWRVFRTVALMLQLATAASLDRYASEFRTRVLQRPDVWHLAAQADIRRRTEFWSQEKRKQEAFHSTHPALSAYVPEQPWNSVIRASASQSEFWSREFEKPAMLYVMNSAKSVPARPPGPSSSDDQSWMKPQPKKKVNNAWPLSIQLLSLLSKRVLLVSFLPVVIRLHLGENSPFRDVIDDSQWRALLGPTPSLTMWAAAQVHQPFQQCSPEPTLRVCATVNTAHSSSESRQLVFRQFAPLTAYPPCRIAELCQLPNARL